MIVKVCKRVTNVRGMVSYLMGPGKGQVHTNQHTVSGTIQYAEQDSPQLRRQLTSDLEMHSKLHPDVQIKGGNVYHVVLSLPPEDGQLTDAKWNQVSTEFMDRMGMTGTGGKATMWTAIRHGVSGDGNDHVHILTNLVRQDGTRVSLHNDMVRASKIARDLEQKHGLSVVAGRQFGGNQVPYTGGEIGNAQRGGREIERVECERKIRAMAEASSGEAEFVRRVRAAGVQVRPFRGAGGAVTGYSASIPGSGVAFAGGKLARDLSLPALRRRWAEAKPAQNSAQHEWVKGRDGQPVTRYGTETRDNMPQASKVEAELGDLRERITTAVTPAHVREISRDLAGALAAGAQVDPKLAKPAREIAAWAPRRAGSRRFTMASVTMALLVASQGRGRQTDLLLTKMTVDALMEMYRLHRMRAQSVHVSRSTTRGVLMNTPDDGLDEVLESTAQTGAVAVVAGVQHLAQIGQDRLTEEAAAKEAMVRSNRGPAFGGGGTYASRAMGPDSSPRPEDHPAAAAAPTMTPKQGDTLVTIANRAGLDVTELRLGDLSYSDDMSLGQAKAMIDALGDPRFGSSGHMRHVLDELRAERGLTAPVAAAAATGRAPGSSTAQQYARTPQQKLQGPDAGKNFGHRKV